MTLRRRGALLLGVTAWFGPMAACGEAFHGRTQEGGGSGGDSGASTGSGEAGGPAPDGGFAAGGRGPGGGGGEPNDPIPTACTLDDDCGEAASACLRLSCVDGACVESPLEESTPCDDGACDGQGHCVTSSCNSKEQDGDETGVDCGGACEPCPDGQGCAVPADCLSGVCTDHRCKASACTDKTQNGDETGVDCGGACQLKCGLGHGCSSAADCAIAAGDYAESVRCVAKVCVSTKPPSETGLPRYWQDFRVQRLVSGTASCGANDDVCLVGNGAAYQMHGLAPDGGRKALTNQLFTTDGAVGGGGKFDGTLCLSRVTSNLSLADMGALSVMAWVKPTRDEAPWEGAIIGALDHYFIAVDSNPMSQRFLAALATSQSTSFAYRSSTAAGELPKGAWHHVAQVYDTAVAKMLQYVDGKVVNSTAISGNLTSGAASVFLGCRKDASLGQFFIGLLDEVVVYPRALSSEELETYVSNTQPPP
jgi:hypothetical protein